MTATKTIVSRNISRFYTLVVVSGKLCEETNFSHEKLF